MSEAVEAAGRTLYPAECDVCDVWLGRWFGEERAARVVADHKAGKFYTKCGQR